MRKPRGGELSRMLLGALALVACGHMERVPESQNRQEKQLTSGLSRGGCLAAEEFAAEFAQSETWWSDVRCDLQNEDLDTAQRKLEMVLRSYAGTGHTSEAAATFFLSEVYFRKGELEKFAAYLRDARARSAKLPGWLKDVELPLRSAQMELRLGSIREFKELSKLAGENLAHYRLKKLIPSEEIARALLQLGHFRWAHQDSVASFTKQLELWNWSQHYLIQVLESEHQELWPLASDLIVENYQAIASNIRSWPREIASDPALSAYRQQESQWEMIYHTLHVMEELKVLPLEPGENSSWLMQRVGELAKVESDLREIYHQQPVASDLTPASQSRQRPLRTLSPDPVFEDPNL